MTKEKEKILILTSSFPAKKNSFRGGGNFVYDLATFLSKDYSIIVLTPLLNNTLRKEKFDEINIYRFAFLPFKSLYKYFSNGILSAFKENSFLKLLLPLFLICQLFALKKVLKKEKNIRLIHTHWLIPQGFIASLHKNIFNKKIKILSTSHGSDILSFNSGIGLKMKKYALKNIDELTVVSNYLKEKILETVFKNPIHVYPMGLKTNDFLHQKADIEIKKKYDINGELLLFIGRLTEVKGLKYLLKAMPEIINNHPNIKLLIVGDGVLKNRLIAQVSELNIKENIVFCGQLDHHELPKYYATSDIFIGPSLSEGFGLTFAEAACSGTIVVASSLPSIKDIIINEKTGFLVKPKSHKDISDTVLKILSSENDLTAIKKNASEHVIKNFDWGKVAKNYNSLYSKLLQNN
ncbi:MAG: glycosyltransferase family 4 protein [Bacteroidota bacterium]|nr:glycosyltransferase family 4 protein [Bacteroidota bacterium]